DEREAVAAQDAQREIVDDALVAEALRHVDQFRDELARAFAGVDAHLHLAHALAPFAAFAAQAFQAAYAAFVARAARFDAFADPRLLLRPELVEFAVEIGRASCR